VRHFNNLPQEIKPHFVHFCDLVNSAFPLEVCLAYLFYRVELAHRDTLYCGTVKLHHAEAEMAGQAVRTQHLTREAFLNIFRILFGKELKKEIAEKLQKAEEIRDKAMHGSEPTEAEMRVAIMTLLEYAKDYNEFVKSLAQFPPFGDLRGFHGKGKRLEKATTRLVLKGLGFNIN
jgi:hypothetical protein